MKSSNVKNLSQFSLDEQRERRYPFLVAIDLLLYFGLTFASIILTAVALLMALHAIWPRLFGWF